VEIRPLDIMVVDQTMAARVAVPAYDLLSAADRQRILSEDSLSYLNAIRLPQDYPPGEEREPDRHLHDSLAALRRMVNGGVFRRVDGPAMFIYRIATDTHHQTAIVADVPVDAYKEGSVLPHEETRIDKQSGLGNYLNIVRASSSPVCLAYRPVAAIDDLVGQATAEEPDVDFVASLGTRQQVWQITDPFWIDQLIGLFREVPHTYITDGHHRVAATAQNGSHDSFLAALFPVDQMRLVAYHRCIRDLGTETPAGLLERLQEKFDVTTLPTDSEPPAPASGVISMCLGGRWHHISLKKSLRPARPWEDLDVVTVQEQVLRPLLGIGDPRSDPRLACVTSRISPQAIAGWVDSGIYEVAFLLHPMSLEQLMAVSDAGRTLPPKSSWFTPKAGSGIFLRFGES
jgi:uncharacterized protein (DUF1015 family)